MKSLPQILLSTEQIKLLEEEGKVTVPYPDKDGVMNLVKDDLPFAVDEVFVNDCEYEGYLIRG